MNEVNSTTIGDWRVRNKKASSTNLSQEYSSVKLGNSNSLNSNMNSDSNEASVGSWQARVKKNLNKTKEKSKENSVSPALKGSRIITYQLYCLSWKFMFSLFLLPILYLWVHFLIRYVGSFSGFSNFVNPYSPAGLQEEMQKDGGGNTDFGWMVVFILLSVVVLAILALLVILIYIIVKTFDLTFWEKLKIVGDTAKAYIAGGGIEEAFSKYLDRILEN